MRFLKQIIFISFFILVAASCKKDNTVVEPTMPTMNDLVVPADFDWKTTQTLTVNIILPAEGEIQPLIITNRDGSIRYFRGYPEDGSRIVNTVITIPTLVSELRLTYNGTTGPNMVFVSNQSLSYNFNSSTKSTDVVGCDLSGFTTYSKGGWGQGAHGNNVGALRDQYFDQVYPTNFVIGGNFKITFSASSDVENYLPGGGGPAVLDENWTNPVKNDKLGNMADQIIAARLNRDYNEAGFLGVNPNFSLGELVFRDGDFANISVNDFLEMAEIALGGGNMNGFTPSQFSDAAENIILSFHEGTNANILTCPSNPTQDDPFIELTGICTQPDVIFTISNTGDGPMTTSKTYSLLKNNVEISNGTYQLTVNQTLNVTATGDQTDEFKLVVETPRDVTLEEVITGCGNSGGDPTTEQLSGSLAYEDLWPGKGDYDFNDLIIDYDFEINKDNQEYVQSIQVTFTIKAFGASFHNGFGFTLPTVLPNDIVSVSGYNVINNTVFNLEANGLESGQSKATIIVFDDTRRVMPQTTGGIGVNTQLAYAFIDPVSIVVNITFANNAITYNELNIGTFNPFIIVNTTVNGAPGARGLEVHLPYYAPSDLFDDSYFGQFDDDSSIAAGRYFVTSNNLPWAINIAGEFDWVIEFQDITGAYNWFGEWAESGGINYADWYKDYSGYRNDNLIYPTQVVK